MNDTTFIKNVLVAIKKYYEELENPELIEYTTFKVDINNKNIDINSYYKKHENDDFDKWADLKLNDKLAGLNLKLKNRR